MPVSFTEKPVNYHQPLLRLNTIKRNPFHILIALMTGLFLFQTTGTMALGVTVQLEEILAIERGPEGRPFQRLTSVIHDRSRNEILIVDSGANRVYILDSRGEFKNVLGRGEELKKPVGVAVDRKGTIYISEHNSATIKIFEGEAGRMSGTFSEMVLPVENGEIVSPGKLAIGPEGRIFVVEEKKGWIFVFDSERKYQYRMGSKGMEGQGFTSIADVASDPRGTVYSASRGMNPLNEFDRSGQFVQPIRDPRNEMEEIIDPVGIAVDSRNRLWVLDRTRENLSIYGPTGSHMETIEEEDIPGGLFIPVDIDFDGFDNLLILEQGSGRLRLFSQRY